MTYGDIVVFGVTGCDVPVVFGADGTSTLSAYISLDMASITEASVFLFTAYDISIDWPGFSSSKIIVYSGSFSTTSTFPAVLTVISSDDAAKDFGIFS